jgi:hypothetical protein
MMERVDEAMLMAFVDGELDAAEAARVELALAADPELKARVQAEQRLKATLAQRYDPILDEPVKERFAAMLGANVVPIGSARRRPAFALRWPQAAAIAATLVAGVLAFQLVPADAPEPEPRVAQGALAEALETQLASQPTGATRIGVTFAAHDGRICRTFEASGATGLACRGAESWELMATGAAEGGRAGEYRQAGSGAAKVMQLAQDMMAGEPFDAAAERRARDSGWRRNER